MDVALPTKIKLEIVSPNRLVLSQEVDEVTFPGSEGYLGILPGHLPLLTMLGIGVLSYHVGTHKKALAVSGGFAEVLPDHVIILADTVELPEEINLERAKEAKARAEKEFHAKDVNVDQCMAALMRATARIQVAEMRK